MVMTGGRYSLLELADCARVSPTTIRFWVSRGYLPRSLGRGSTRYFTATHLERARRLRQLREDQRTLAEIAEYLDSTPDG
jgi:DNA-binding transcriptional MerR regulator